MSEQPDLSTLPQRMRYAAGVLKEADKRYGDPWDWSPDALLVEADRWEAQDRKHADREQLVEELAKDAYEAWYNGRDKWAGASDTKREFWRHRALRLIEAGWRKGNSDE